MSSRPSLHLHTGHRGREQRAPANGRIRFELSWIGSGSTVELPTDNHAAGAADPRTHNARRGVGPGRPVAESGKDTPEGVQESGAQSAGDQASDQSVGGNPDGAAGDASPSDPGSPSGGDDPSPPVDTAPPPPSPEGESAQPFAQMVAGLGTIGAGSDPKTLVGGLQDALALKTFAEAKQAELVVALHQEFARQLGGDTNPTDNSDDDVPDNDSDADADADGERPRFVVGEDGKPVSVQIAEHADRMVRVDLEMAYKWSSKRAGSLIANAHFLHQHPDVEAAVASGRFELSKAQVLLYGMVGVEDEANRQRIIDELLPDAADKTHGQLHQETLAWVLRLEPEAIERRKKDKVARRGVRLTEAVDCVADLQVFGLPVDQAVAAYQHVDYLARAAKAAGSTRGLGQLRADIATALLLGQIPSSAHDLGDDNPDGDPALADLDLDLDFDFTGLDKPNSNTPDDDRSPTDGSSGDGTPGGSPGSGSPGSAPSGGSPAPQGTSPDSDTNPDAGADADAGAGADGASSDDADARTNDDDGASRSSADKGASDASASKSGASEQVPDVDEDDPGSDETREAEFGDADDLADRLAVMMDDWFTDGECAEDCAHHSTGCDCRPGGGCRCDCHARYAVGQDATRMDELHHLAALIVYAGQILGRDGLVRRRFTDLPSITTSDYTGAELIDQLRTRLALLLADYKLTLDDLETRYQQATSTTQTADADADAAASDEAGSGGKSDGSAGGAGVSPGQRIREQIAQDAAAFGDLLPQGFAEHPDADKPDADKPAGGGKPRRLKGWPAPRGRSMTMLTMPLDQYLQLMGVLGVIDEHGQIPGYGNLTTRPAELAGIGPLLAHLAQRVITACLENPDGNRFALAITDPRTGQLIQYHPIDKRLLTGLQREASDARSLTCVLPTCRVSALSCDADHAQDYARTLITFLDQMDKACRSHHQTNEVPGNFRTRGLVSLVCVGPTRRGPVPILRGLLVAAGTRLSNGACDCCRTLRCI